MKRLLLHPYVLGLVAALLGLLAGLASHLPVAMIVGPLFGCFVAALLRVRIGAPLGITRPLQLLLGILIGSHFSLGIVDDPAKFGIVLGGGVAATLVMTILGSVYLVNLAGYDRLTSALSATPGGVYTAAVIAAETGGNLHAVTLMQAMRAVITVLVVPPIVGFVTMAAAGPAPAAIARDADPITLAELMLILIPGAIASLTVVRLGMRGGALVAGMIVTSALFSAGLVDGEFPPIVSQGCAFLLGYTVGARLNGITGGAAARHFFHGIVGSLLMILVAAAASVLAARATDWSFAELFLGFAPGGIGETTVAAILLGLDAAVVGLLQIARLLFINVSLPLIAWMYAADGLEERTAAPGFGDGDEDAH